MSQQNFYCSVVSSSSLGLPTHDYHLSQVTIPESSAAARLLKLRNRPPMSRITTEQRGQGCCMDVPLKQIAQINCSMDTGTHNQTANVLPPSHTYTVSNLQ